MVEARVLLESVGRAIRQERNRQGRNLSELADHCRLDPTHLSKIERGRLGFSLETLARLAQGLEVSPMFLLCPEDRPLRSLLRTPEPVLPEHDLLELITLGLAGTVIYRDTPQPATLQKLSRALLEGEAMSPASRAVLETWLAERSAPAPLDTL